MTAYPKRAGVVVIGDDVVGAVHLAGDGQINPVDVTLALAKGAKQRGARIFEDAKVLISSSSAAGWSACAWTAATSRRRRSCWRRACGRAISPRARA